MSQQAPLEVTGKALVKVHKHTVLTSSLDSGSFSEISLMVDFTNNCIMYKRANFILVNIDCGSGSAQSYVLYRVLQETEPMHALILDDCITEHPWFYSLFACSYRSCI